MPRITVYVSDWCNNCKIITPKIAEYARRNGYQFEKVDVDKCTTETCESVSYVPHILVDGRPMSDAQLERIING